MGIVLRGRMLQPAIQQKPRRRALRFDTGIRLGRTPILLTEEGMHQIAKAINERVKEKEK